METANETRPGATHESASSQGEAMSLAAADQVPNPTEAMPADLSRLSAKRPVVLKIGRGYLVILLALLLGLVLVVGASVWMYQGHGLAGHELHEGGVFDKDDVVIDFAMSFARDGREKIVCYRESHRNFYVFVFELTLAIVALMIYGIYMQLNLTRRISDKNNELLAISARLADRNEQIMASLRFGQLIQRSMMPQQAVRLNQVLGQGGFVWLEPRELVSGDFFWIEEVAGYRVVAVADCTGHGVPGAFLSMLGVSALDKIIRIEGELDPGQILTRLNRQIYDTLVRGAVGRGLSVGMEITVVVIEPRGQVYYAAAGHKLYVCDGSGTVSQQVGERITLGLYEGTPYRTQNLETPPGGTMLYLSSDGVTDQFGGASERKFGRKALKETLETIHRASGPNKRARLINTLRQWQGACEQVDDILIVGVEI